MFKIEWSESPLCTVENLEIKSKDALKFYLWAMVLEQKEWSDVGYDKCKVWHNGISKRFDCSLNDYPTIEDLEIMIETLTNK